MKLLLKEDAGGFGNSNKILNKAIYTNLKRISPKTTQTGLLCVCSDVVFRQLKALLWQQEREYCG